MFIFLFKSLIKRFNVEFFSCCSLSWRWAAKCLMNFMLGINHSSSLDPNGVASDFMSHE